MNRKWMISSLMLAVLVVTAFGVRHLTAKDAGKADEPKAIVEELVAKLKSEDYAGFTQAIQNFNANIYTDDERKKMEADPKFSPKVGTAMLQAVVEKMPGKFTGVIELAGKEGVGTGYVRYLIIQRFEYTALVYKPTFYRTPKGWFLCELNYDTNLSAHLKPMP